MLIWSSPTLSSGHADALADVGGLTAAREAMGTRSICR